MQVLSLKEWINIPLDYCPTDDQTLVHVNVMINLTRADDAYFKRQASPRMVWNYIQEIGLKATLIKVLSRFRERRRNDKFLSVGLGLRQSGENLEPVVFIAPFHPACADLLAISERLIVPAGPEIKYTGQHIRHGSLIGKVPPAFDDLLHMHGWSTDAGEELPAFDWSAIKRLIIDTLESGSAGLSDGPLIESARAPVTTRPASANNRGAGTTATLFGLGNYAKTIIMPNLPSGLRIDRIHEIDPLQFSANLYEGHTCDSSPDLRDDDTNRILFIAGFHHTHAPLAIAALRRDAHVAVEKPLITTAAQLDGVLEALKSSKGSYHSCFNKRYLDFNRLIRQDLDGSDDAPINYHTIIYEVPLPLRHWYRWPNSCTRIVSNGCHWLDHFLFLNNFCPVERHSAFCAPDGTINVNVTLANNACFSMLLTDIGSERIGIQDYIELRQGGTTVKMINSGRYEAENGHRILRRARAERLHGHKNMYRQIGQKILDNDAGDSAHSIDVSSRLTLLIEQEVSAA